MSVSRDIMKAEKSKDFLTFSGRSSVDSDFVKLVGKVESESTLSGLVSLILSNIETQGVNNQDKVWSMSPISPSRGKGLRGEIVVPSEPEDPAPYFISRLVFFYSNDGTLTVNQQLQDPTSIPTQQHTEIFGSTTFVNEQGLPFRTAQSRRMFDPEKKWQPSEEIMKDLSALEALNLIKEVCKNFYNVLT